MKRGAFILILLSFCGIHNTHAESEYTFSPKTVFSLNKFENCFKQTLPNLHGSIVESGESDHNPLSKKGKKRKKAIQPTLVYFADEQYFKIIDLKITSPYFLETFYSFFPYFGDDERGPPVAVTVS